MLRNRYDWAHVPSLHSPRLTCAFPRGVVGANRNLMTREVPTHECNVHDDNSNISNNSDVSINGNLVSLPLAADDESRLSRLSAPSHFVV